MKRITMLLMGALTGLYCTVAIGQTTTIGESTTTTARTTAPDGQNSMGIKGGLNIGNISSFGNESRLSGHGGIFLNHAINTYLAIQPELLFSGEGQQYFADGFARQGEVTVALNYIQLPVMIQYYPITRLYIEAGPQFGLLITAKSKPEGGNSVDVKDQYTTGQVAIGAGLGVKATDEVIFYARYNFGLTDINKVNVTSDHSNVGQVGIAIRLKH